MALIVTDSEHERVAAERRAAPAAAGDDPDAREREREADPRGRAGSCRGRWRPRSSATSAGTAPTISAAWLTLVRSMPAFWSTITRP